MPITNAQAATPDSPATWALGGFYWPDSSCTVWPATRVKVPTYVDEFLVFEPQLNLPSFFAVLDVHSVRAVRIKWRSPWSQRMLYPRKYGKKGLMPAVRAFIEGKEASILVISANEAFYLIPINNQNNRYCIIRP